MLQARTPNTGQAGILFQFQVIRCWGCQARSPWAAPGVDVGRNPRVGVSEPVADAQLKWRRATRHAAFPQTGRGLGGKAV